MSNPLAIATVTATLRNLLSDTVAVDPPVADARVTTTPPDKARDGITSNQLNLFLYETSLNPAWRNANLPAGKNGESGHPPLPLNLHYLLTAYGQNNDEVLAHRLLGTAMAVLHDHPLLGVDELRDSLPGNDLFLQAERVRVVPHPLSLDEMSKLWTTFQTQYRVSATYQVAVVLIESARPAVTPLPVLGRGARDDGFRALASVESPLPTLVRIVLPNRRPSARLGDVISIEGLHLLGATRVHFAHPRLTAPNDLTAEPDGTDLELAVRLPQGADAASWIAGTYAVSATFNAANGDGAPRRTNELALTVAPRITSALPITRPRDATGRTAVILTCEPRVLPEQRASLLLGGREVRAEPHPAPTDTLTFVVPAAEAGEHLIRLRVDGVDSLLVDHAVQPPVFDASQKVVIT